jgi:hypothetical protein
MNKRSLFFLLCSATLIKYSAGQIAYPGDLPGKAMVKTAEQNQTSLENNIIKLVFVNKGGRILIKSFEDIKTHEQLNLTNTPLFELTLQNKNVITSNDFILERSPISSELTADADATTYANKFPGKKYEADLINKKLGLRVHWQAELRDSSNYIRQQF